MSRATLERWSTLAAVLGGVVFVASNLFLVGADYEDFADTLTTRAFTTHTVLFWSAATFFLFGLVGLYTRQAERAGLLGFSGFLVAFVGTAFALATTWSETFGLAVLAEEAPELVDDPPGRVAAGLYISFPLFVLGWLLFAVASLRAGVLQRRPVVGLIVGAAALVPSLAVPGVGALFGAAVAWLGYAELRSKRPS